MNLITLGIDVSSFSPEKIAILNNFIALFDRLEKYDGKVFTPALGGGLTEFNTAIKQSTVLLSELDNKIKQLNSQLASNTSTTNASTSATNNNTKALGSQTQGRIKALEAETRMAAARTRTATADLVAAANANKLAVANLASASASTKAAATSQVELTAKKLVSASNMQLAAAQSQATAAADQLAMAQNRVAIASTKSATEQAAAAAMVVRATIAVEASNVAITRAGTSSTAAMEQASTAMVSATSSSMNLGAAARGAFSMLRNLAYILPGLGIAGIFNIAIEAMSKAAEELGLFNDENLEQIKLAGETNKRLDEQIDRWEELVQLRRELNQLAGSDLTFKGGGVQTNSTYQQQVESTERSSARGVSKDIVINDQLADAQKKIIDAQRALGIGPSQIKDEGGLEIIIAKKKKALDEYVITLQTQNAKISELERLLNQGKYDGDKGRDQSFDKEAVSAELDAAKSSFSLTENQYQNQFKLIKDYYESKQELAVQDLERTKFFEDQERKRKVETGKNNLEVVIDTNEKILNAEITSEVNRLAALDRIRQNQKSINRLDLFNVINNNSSTAAEKEIAINANKNANLSLDIKFEQDRDKIREDYRQRRIKASTQIAKDEVEATAISNERIFQNETNTLEQRIKAYEIYVSKKQALQDLEYNAEKERLSLKANDPTAKLELEALESNRYMMQSNIQADTENKVYGFFKDSLDKQFKDLKDANDVQESEQITHYTKELIALNKSFDDKKISLTRYREERSKLDESYREKDLDEQIQDDKNDIRRLEEERLKEIEKSKSAESKVKISQAELALDPNNLSLKSDFDAAVGEAKARAEAIKKIDDQIAKEKDELRKDELEKEKRKYTNLKDYEKEYAANRKAIIDALYKLAKTAIDGEYQQRLQQLQEETKVRNEQYSDEASAIEQSTLSQKNKAALQIQLNAEKQAMDKNAAAEEKKLKQEQAALDKQLAIAHILIATQESVISALKVGFPAGEILAAQRAILGGIAVATVVATPIPSYAEGTESHPGGLARYGEAGPEIVKEPYKSPYLVLTETISYLPKGTEVIPISEMRNTSPQEKESGWEQTRWLAKQINKKKQEIRNEFKPTINIDLGFVKYKQDKLGY